MNGEKDYVSLSLAAPEFGPRKLYANFGGASGQGDDSVFAAIGNAGGLTLIGASDLLARAVPLLIAANLTAKRDATRRRNTRVGVP
ncbi:hypothetical protein [Bradyrhizobium sp. WSM2793]|uniref:hypothetical protein n=1 Tax=Bradyrhizobium sp. WSM2793 TaxID=1038866 RepID=UPI000360E023|nr:hypothetical protein [Bradyrhizobium sp. WSM2793]